MKWTHHILLIGKVVHCWNLCDSPNCPVCNAYDDHDHLLTFEDESDHPLKHKLIANLCSCLDRDQYNPILCEILIEGFSSVLLSPPFSFNKFPLCYQLLCQSQSNPWLGQPVERLLFPSLALTPESILCHHLSAKHDRSTRCLLLPSSCY